MKYRFILVYMRAFDAVPELTYSVFSDQQFSKLPDKVQQAIAMLSALEPGQGIEGVGYFLRIENDGCKYVIEQEWFR